MSPSAPYGQIVQRLGWGNSHQSLLHLFHSVIFSRLLCALFLVSIASRQWESLEKFHRVALSFSLGLPSYTPNILTLVEAENSPLHPQAEERTMRHMERFTVIHLGAC